MKHLPIEDWEVLLKNGEGHQVKGFIKELNLTQVKREQAAPLANLSHRLNLPLVAIRVLNPIVRQQGLSLEPANEIELAEYSIGLTRLGVFDESRQILEQLSTEINPKVFLYRAFVQMSQWQYRSAVSLLRSYIARIPSDAYQKTVAQVNLAACLVFLEEIESAENLLSELRKNAEAGGFHVLLGNANELMGQVALLKNDLSSAESFLREGQKFLHGSQSIGAFFIEKWQTITNIRKHGWNEDARLQLLGLKKRALSLKHWETLRDCDYAEALLTRDENLIQHLYFGTPYKEYRHRLRQKFNLRLSWRSQYLCTLGSNGLNDGVVLDVFAGSLEGGGHAMNPGQLLHQLLFILAKDFYRPLRLGVLFAALYPGEHFDPDSSYDRVHKSIQRLRAWFVEANVPLTIQEHSGFYQLVATGQVSFKVDLRDELPRTESLQLHKLRQTFSSRGFTTSEAAQCLELSQSSVLTFLRPYLVSGEIKKGRRARDVLFFKDWMILIRSSQPRKLSVSFKNCPQIISVEIGTGRTYSDHR